MALARPPSRNGPASLPQKQGALGRSSWLVVSVCGNVVFLLLLVFWSANNVGPLHVGTRCV
jgi:hypothetical protein